MSDRRRSNLHTRRVALFLTAICLAVTVVVAISPVMLGAQITEQTERPEPLAIDFDAQLLTLTEAVVRLPIAAILGAVLAFRSRRRGTPPRSAPVIHTQIILAVLGALIMLVVGSSLARAFGIVGAAGLIRYRAKIDDPKDAGVMLSTLGIGLASGVGMYLLASFATVFILIILWLVESLEPESMKIFSLKVTAKDPAALRTKLEALFKNSRVEFELRSATHEELTFEVKLPYDRRTDRLSNAIMKLDESGDIQVEWDEKKAKKP